MHDHAPRPTGSDLEALNDSELRTLLARVQSELGRRAMGDTLTANDRSRIRARIIDLLRQTSAPSHTDFDKLAVDLETPTDAITSELVNMVTAGKVRYRGIGYELLD